MADEAKVSFRGVCQALFSLPFLGLNTWTTPHPQPGWSPGTKRQPPTAPCCRSMHSGAMSAVSRNIMQGRSVPEGGTTRVTGLELEGQRQLTAVVHSTSIRAVPKLTTITESGLPRFADSCRCLRGATTGSGHHLFSAGTVWPYLGFASCTPKPWSSQSRTLQQ